MSPGTGGRLADMAQDRNDAARCIPNPTSLDLEERLRFCRVQLGFEGVAFGDYAIRRRDAMEIHFWLARDRIHQEHTACHKRGRQVAALHAEFAACGVPGLSGFAIRPWSMKEVHIIDLHGNLLRFGCAPQELMPNHRGENA